MLKLNLEEIKEFITWAKQEGLKEVVLGELKFVISDQELAKPVLEKAIQDAINESYPPRDLSSNESSNPRVQNMKDQSADDTREDRELLFWSSRS